MSSNIPHNPLGSVFTPDVIKKLQGRLIQIRNDDERERLLTRLNILTAMGEIPRYEPYWRQYAIRYWKAFKAAWDTYIHAAYVCGLFSGKSGSDLIGRLTDTDNDNFQGAIAECLACWLFSGKFKMSVNPRPKGNDGHELEFVVSSNAGELHVEVKSPYRPSPRDSWSGDDSDKIEGCLESANKQFKRDSKNILVLVPSLRLPLYSARGSLIHALYGEEKFVVQFDPQKGQAIGPTTLKFFPEGHFLQFRKAEGKPRFTRTSIVLSVEEKYNERHSFVDHNILILHNPCALQPCEDLHLGDFPEFKRHGDYLRWSDGHQLFP